MEPKRKKMSLQKRHNLIGWAFLIPASLLIFVFCFYPMIQAILLSFHKGMGAAQSWTGISNYTRILKDKTFRQCLFNTVFYFVIQVPIMLLLALILAAISVAFMIPVLMEFAKTGLVPRFPTLIVCCFVLVAALLLFISGIILSSQLAKDARDFEFQLQTVHHWHSEKK